MNHDNVNYGICDRRFSPHSISEKSGSLDTALWRIRKIYAIKFSRISTSRRKIRVSIARFFWLTLDLRTWIAFFTRGGEDVANGKEDYGLVKVLKDDGKIIWGASSETDEEESLIIYIEAIIERKEGLSWRRERTEDNFRALHRTTLIYLIRRMCSASRRTLESF